MNMKTTIKPGDKIRSFDFARSMKDGTVYGTDTEGEEACFVEGIVTKVDVEMNQIHFEVTRQVGEGREISDFFNWCEKNGHPKVMSCPIASWRTGNREKIGALVKISGGRDA
tara:strand:- start:402 stop:737 length:336 start_codon:yes stop_codon:yes gene_type:complete